MFKGLCWVNWVFAMIIAIFAVISVSSILTSCGNKGDLYLPDNSSIKKKK